MADQTTILQHWILTQFVFPFLLVFFIVFGILEKTNIFGAGKKQLNALVAFIIGLIFVGAVFPKLVVANFILFLAVALAAMFVGLILWGFATGGDVKIQSKGLKAFIAFLIFAGLIVMFLWTAGVQWSVFSNVYNFLFKSSWSSDFWTNALFVVMVIAALGFALAGSRGGGGGKSTG